MLRLRDITPRGLYARSLSIVLVPLVLILALMIWYYYDGHIAEVNRKLAQSIARDGAVVKAFCETSQGNLGAEAFLEDSLDFKFDCDVITPPADGAISRYAYAGALRAELRTTLEAPAETWLMPETSMLDVRFPVGDTTVQMLIDRKRAMVINSHIFIVWVVLFSLLMVTLAVAFLNQQVKSIIRLSDAAKAFGRGRDVPDFRPSGATEVREAARSVIDMKNRLTAFTGQRTAMLAGVSHDLRTPLTRLKLALAMMDETDDIKDARADLDDMSAMLDEYLQFASGEEGDEPETMDLAEMTRGIIDGFGPHIGVSGPDRIVVTARPLAVKRAVTNLVSNALKYGVDVRVTLVDGPKAAEVHVDDNGPGIAKADYEDAFRPFSRLDEARSQNTSGSGLGLTLARDTARAHGGDVRLSKSALGGLRASLRLPH